MATATTTPTLEELDLRCPPLPNTLLEAVELTHAPGDPDLKQVVELAQRDPAVAARVLRVVNSAAYGQRSEVTSVQRAVVALGPNTVVGLVLSMSMMDTKNALDAETTLPFLNLARHSVATAFLAQQLGNYAEARHAEQQGTAFTAGLLHDFGKLVFLFNLPGASVRLYGGSERRAVAERYEAERAAFGHNHAAVGAALAEKLRFPGALCRAIALHHDAVDNPDAPPAALIVATANVAANGLGYALDGETTWDEAAAHPIWDRLAGARILEVRDRDELLAIVDRSRERLAPYVDAIF